MDIKQILLIVLFCIEIALVVGIAIFLLFREIRAIKYEKENRKLAIKEILTGAKEVCDDNVRILQENMMLKLENEMLKQKNKELEIKCQKQKTKKATKKTIKSK